MWALGGEFQKVWAPEFTKITEYQFDRAGMASAFEYSLPGKDLWLTTQWALLEPHKPTFPAGTGQAQPFCPQLSVPMVDSTRQKRMERW